MNKNIPLAISIVGVILGVLGFILSISALAFISVVVSIVGLVFAIKSKTTIAIIVAIAGIVLGAFSIYWLAENVIWLF